MGKIFKKLYKYLLIRYNYDYNGARGRGYVPDAGTSQHSRISVSASLGVTSCKSTGTFCTSVCALVASNPAVQVPHLNIRWGAIAITVEASLTASLCAGLILWQGFKNK